MKKLILSIIITLLATVITSCSGGAISPGYSGENEDNKTSNNDVNSSTGDESDFGDGEPKCDKHNYVNNVCQSCNCSLWSGEVDTSRYSAVKKEFEITTSEQLAGFASLDFRKRIKTGR